MNSLKITITKCIILLFRCYPKEEYCVTFQKIAVKTACTCITISGKGAHENIIQKGVIKDV